MSGAERLYTPELLGLTLKLSQYPWDEALPLKGDARSRSCGSTLSVGLMIDPSGKIMRLGMRVQACAVGQAAAALFATSAMGRGLADIELTGQEMVAWLKGESQQPSWPGIEAIDAARSFPGRHGAMMLPWQAALAALSTGRPSG